MKNLWIAIFIVGCELDIKHKGLKDAVPKDFTVQSESDVEAGLDFDKVYEYCEGKVDHQIEEETRIDPDFYISEDDRKFEIGNCYYNFDFNSLEFLD